MSTSTKVKDPNKITGLLKTYLKESLVDAWYLKKDKIFYLSPFFRQKESEKLFSRELNCRIWEYEFLLKKLKKVPLSLTKQVLLLWFTLRKYSKPPSFEHLTNFSKTNVLVALAEGAKRSLKKKHPQIEFHSVFCPHYTYSMESPLYLEPNQKKVKKFACAIREILASGKGLVSKYIIHTVSGRDFEMAPFLRFCLHPTLSTNKKAMELNKQSFGKLYLPILQQYTLMSSIPVVSDHDFLYVEPYAKSLIEKSYKIWGKDNVEKCKEIIIKKFYKKEFQEKYGITPKLYSRNFYLYPATCQCYNAIPNSLDKPIIIFLGLERTISWYFGKGHNIDFTTSTPYGNIAFLSFAASLRQPWAIEKRKKLK